VPDPGGAAQGWAQQEVKDPDGGRLIASVKDANGNAIGLLQSPQSPER
jgi:hypothetical protein